LSVVCFSKSILISISRRWSSDVTHCVLYKCRRSFEQHSPWKSEKILINKVIIIIYLLIRLYVAAIFSLRILHISFIWNSIAQKKWSSIRLSCPIAVSSSLHRSIIKYKNFYKSYCSTVHFRRITSIYQPTNAHIISHKTHLKHFKTLRHVSILSDHYQGTLFLANVILQYSVVRRTPSYCSTTQHDMLPQHLVCKYELNCEYCNITLARNKAP